MTAAMKFKDTCSLEGKLDRILEDSYNSIIKKKQLKMGKETEYTFLQRRYTNGQ